MDEKTNTDRTRVRRPDLTVEGQTEGAETTVDATKVEQTEQRIEDAKPDPTAVAQNTAAVATAAATTAVSQASRNHELADSYKPFEQPFRAIGTQIEDNLGRQAFMVGMGQSNITDREKMAQWLADKLNQPNK